MFKRYYEDELEFLREMGAEFSAAYPDIARELGLAGRDPDVERLLQGTAFLTARIRQSLEAEFPELLGPLLGHLWPHALRPTPAVAMIEFRPRPNMLRAAIRLPRGVRLGATPIEGTSCLFRTAYPVTLLPFTIEDVRMEAETAMAPRLVVALRLLPGANVDWREAGPLRLHLLGAVRRVYDLYQGLSRGLRGVEVRAFTAEGSGGQWRLPAGCVHPVGWTLDEALLPYEAHEFAGYRHLHEYFLFAEKYLFFDVEGLDCLQGTRRLERIEIRFELRPRSGELPTVSRDNLRLHCTPAVNLFEHMAVPLRVDGTRGEYRLRPEGERPEHFDIFSIRRVTGLRRDQTRPVEFQPFFSFGSFGSLGRSREAATLYQVHVHPPVQPRGGAGAEQGTTYPACETYLSFVASSVARGLGPLPPMTVGIDLLATNRDLPGRLRPGDICRTTTDVPAGVDFHNPGACSEAAPAAVDDQGLWRFFAHVLLGWEALASRDTFRSLLALYDLPARFHLGARQKLDVLREAIESVAARPTHRVLGRPPAVVYGTEVRLALHDAALAHEGEMLLLGTALSHFLAETSAINSFTELRLRGVDRGVDLSWEPLPGRQVLV
jgi:type VI secretion system protein ImpG